MIGYILIYWKSSLAIHLFIFYILQGISYKIIVDKGVKIKKHFFLILICIGFMDKEQRLYLIKISLNK